MSPAHTEGLLTVSMDEPNLSAYLVGQDRRAVARVINAGLRGGYGADARRLVACWNACEGISTENLEDNQTVKVLADQYNVARMLLSEVLAKVEPETDAQDELFPRICAFLKGGAA